MRITWSAAVALCVLAAAASTADAAPASPHVRAASAQVRKLIEDTAARSPVVRALVARLAGSDVIVYVEMTFSPQVPRARTKLVTASSGVRFLRIGINGSVSGGDLAPLLAHELQHAVEIADRADVRDDDAVRRLYAAIGRPARGDTFETDAALDVEWQVRLECRQHAEPQAPRVPDRPAVISVEARTSRRAGG